MKKQKFSPADLLEDMLSVNFDPSVFNAVDDRDFPKAPNFLEWCIGPQFLNTRVLPKQVAIAAELFSDWCPRCSNPGYINTLYDQSIGEIQDNIQFLEHGKCPKCKATRFELIDGKELVFHNELAGANGQRSGKSKLVGLIGSYCTHRFLKIPNPLQYFRQPSGERLIGTFSGMTLGQAVQNLWSSYQNFIEASPWFQQYHKFLESEGKRLSTELYHNLKTSVGYPLKQMFWHATGSQDRKMRGATRIFCAVDELGWFISDDQGELQNMSADGVYTALSNSMTTMRIKYRQLWGPDDYDAPPVIMANVSSPSSAKDKIMRLYKSSTTNPRILGVNYATWESNPDVSYEALREEFSHEDEKVFMRDFGAQPPIATNPFLSDPDVIDRIATGPRISQLEPIFSTELDSFSTPFKTVKALIKTKDKTTPRLISLDLGYHKNAYAFCMFSLTPDFKPKLDIGVTVTPENKMRANLVHIFEHWVMPIVEHFNIKYAFFDRWQSIDQIERLREKKVDASIHSLTYKEMDAVRGTIISEGVIIPRLDSPMNDYVKEYVQNDDFTADNPSATLGMQLLTVRDTKSKFLKPLVGDDDLFRAFCLGVLKINDKKIKTEFKTVRTQAVSQSSVPLGMVKTKSSGYGGHNNFSGNSNMGTYRGRRG